MQAPNSQPPKSPDRVGKALPRWSKEIKAVLSNREYDAAYYDENGLIYEDDPHTVYILVTPKGGMYQNLQFLVSMKLKHGAGDDIYVYPFNPPAITMTPPLYHANIYPKGSICLDVLRDDKWTPLTSLDGIIQNLLLLLETPNSSSPANSAAAADYKAYSNDKRPNALERYRDLLAREHDKAYKGAQELITKIVSLAKSP